MELTVLLKETTRKEDMQPVADRYSIHQVEISRIIAESTPSGNYPE